MFAKYYAGRSNNRLCWEDLYQEAWIILRNTNVPTKFLPITAKRGIIKVFKKLEGNVGSHRNIGNRNYVGETNLRFAISKESPVGSELETLDFMEQLMNDATPEDKATVMAICSGNNMAGAGRLLGVTRQTIGNRLRKINKRRWNHCCD